MNSRRAIITVVLFLTGIYSLRAQTSATALRDYVTVIHQSYHPGVVDYVNTLKKFAENRGEDDMVRNIDAFLKGGFGSGFVYVDSEGNNYIITNYHVIARAYSISIEFEKTDGSKTLFSGLNILAADEDMDIAILAFPASERPFQSGLSFVSRAPDEGEDVYSAGFPGLGNNPVWQFGRGIVSNSRVLIPPSDDDSREYGPWIQHTAQIDAGNSGGPLLIAQNDPLALYAVIGVNTASGINRQAANYAIPISRVETFIEASLKKTETGEALKKLEERAAGFVQGLSANRVVYSHIARYLSNECAARNAALAIFEVERASRSVQNDIFNQHLFTAIDYAVGWLIELELREINTDAVLRPSLGAIRPNADGTWTVALGFPGEKEINTIWIIEYGMWRIKSVGSVSGNRTAAVKKTEAETGDKKPRAGYDLAISAGGAYLGLGSDDPRGPAFDLAVHSVFSNGSIFSGVHLVFKSLNFGIVEGLIGYTRAIQFDNFTVMPLANIGIGISWHEKDADDEFESDWDDDRLFSKLSMGFSIQAGLMFTLPPVSGLFVKTAYQFNYYDGELLIKRNVPLPASEHGLILSLGYCY
jgi:serine protease Do